MSALLDALPGNARSRARKGPQPEWTEPMLARLSHDRFSDPAWIFERKLDGERCLAFCGAHGRIRLMSRNRKEHSSTYPELVDALRAQRVRGWIVDGEIVAFRGNVTSFERLQPRMQISGEAEARASRVAVYYYLFDVLYVDGHDVSRVPLRQRKRLLRRLFDYTDPLRFTPHRNESGEAYFGEACRKGWEGLIAKRADSVYAHQRSSDWLKLKCVHEQEFVVGGWTDPEGGRTGFGALLIGYYDDGALRYAGKVGTGYDEDTLRRLSATLHSLRRATSPFDDDVRDRHAHFVTPKLVAEVGFTEWTRDRRLRHPRYRGMREDKAAKDVVREEEGGRGGGGR